jgi:hypothetical protein
MSAIVRKRFGWTGWLLVLVYLGALSAISLYITHSFLFLPELSFYDVFIEVIISTLILYVLAQVYRALNNNNYNSYSKWWARGLKLLSFIFGFIGLTYLSISLVLFFSISAIFDDPNFNKFNPELQHSLIQNSYFFAILLAISSIVAFTAAIGLAYRRKIGWYTVVALVLLQIVAVTGLLDKQRATDFVLPPEIAKQLSEDRIYQIEIVFVPMLMNGVFATLVANIVIVTFLTLPRVLAIFNMPPVILASRLGKGHHH